MLQILSPFLIKHSSKFLPSLTRHPANVDNMALLRMLANGGWDLIRRLKGQVNSTLFERELINFKL